MKPIHVCVPVLKRYDLLRNLVLSLCQSNAALTLHVIDNGLRGEKLRRALLTTNIAFDIFTPEEPLGVAASWNTFIANVPEERVIVNDDVVFAPDSLRRLVDTNADIAWADGCGFSCFLLRDSCVAKLGLFDTSISPGYAYYEDEDYLQRLDGHGTREPSAIAENIACGVQHVHSGTLKASSPEELQEHHRKFKIAQANYARKWHLEKDFVRDEMQKAMAQ